MKKILFHSLFIMLFSTSSLCFYSCDNLKENPEEELAIQKNESLATMIQENVFTILDDSTKCTQNWFIIYSASENETVICSELAYIIVDNILYNHPQNEISDSMVVGNMDQTRAAPQGPGWKNAGRFSGKLGGIRVVNKMAEDIPAGHDVEIYLEYHEDGSYTLWYRVV